VPIASSTTFSPTSEPVLPHHAGDLRGRENQREADRQQPAEFVAGRVEHCVSVADRRGSHLVHSPVAKKPR
jgi:hypothetical protein